MKNRKHDQMRKNVQRNIFRLIVLSDGFSESKTIRENMWIKIMGSTTSHDRILTNKEQRGKRTSVANY